MEHGKLYLTTIQTSFPTVNPKRKTISNSVKVRTIGDQALMWIASETKVETLAVDIVSQPDHGASRTEAR